jgi:hypothetical protein
MGPHAIFNPPLDYTFSQEWKDDLKAKHTPSRRNQE